MNKKNRTPKSKHNYIHIFVLSKWWLFGISFLLTIITSICMLFPTYAFKLVYDLLLPDKNLKGIINVVIIMILIYLIGAIISLCNTTLNAYINKKIENDIRLYIIEQIFKRPYKEILSIGQGQILTRLQSDIVSIAMWVALIIGTIATNIANFFTTVSFIFYLNKQVAIGLLTFIPVYIFIIWIFKKPVYSQQIKVQNTYSKVVNFLQDIINGLKDISLATSGKYFVDKLDEEQNENLKQSIKMNIISSTSRMLANLIALIGPLFIFTYGCFLVIKEKMSVGTLISFMSVSSRVFTSVSTICNFAVQRYSIQVSNNRIKELIYNQIEDNIIDIKLNDEISGLIVENVSVKYNDRQIFSNLSFTVPKGTTCVLKGANGAGKSTLLEVIAGIQRPTSGHVLIDNVPIDCLTKEDLRKKVALVPQNPHIFNLTLRENLMYISDKCSQDDLKRYCEIAGLNDASSQLTYTDLETILGATGRTLSGGEASRIALIRALLLNPEILILDETFAPLPIESENSIISKLREANKDMIIIIVSHRQMSIEEEVDLELFLDNKGDIISNANKKGSLKE